MHIAQSGWCALASRRGGAGSELVPRKHLLASSLGGVHCLHLPWSLITGKVLATFYHLCKSLGLPPGNESLQSWHCPLSTRLGPPETAMPVAQNTTTTGLPAISTAYQPAVCCSNPSSPRSRPNQDQQPTVVAQPFTPGAKATQNNWFDAVGSDSESS